MQKLRLFLFLTEILLVSYSVSAQCIGAWTWSGTTTSYLCANGPFVNINLGANFCPQTAQATYSFATPVQSVKLNFTAFGTFNNNGLSRMAVFINGNKIDLLSACQISLGCQIGLIGTYSVNSGCLIDNTPGNDGGISGFILLSAPNFSVLSISSVGVAVSEPSASGTIFQITACNGSCPNAAPPPAPVASFSVSSPTVCVGSQLTFFDLSTNSPTSWSWQFPGGSPATATTNAPAITFSNAGSYSVTLTSSNTTGPSSMVSQVINVIPVPSMTVVATKTAICLGDSIALTASGALSYTWNTLQTGPSISSTPVATTAYTVKGSNSAGCQSSLSAQVIVNPIPFVSVLLAPQQICMGGSSTLSAYGANIYSWSTGQNGQTVVVSPTITNNYSIVGISISGCIGTATVSLPVNSLPVLTVTPNGTSICQGNSVALIASGANSYTWSTGQTVSGINVSPGATTVYTITGTANTGCNNSTSVTVQVNALPVLTITPANGTVCSGSNLQLVASGATSYTWSFGQSGSNVIINPVSNSVYTVIGTSFTNCTGSKNVTVQVYPLPVLTVTTNHTKICVGENIILTVLGASTYSWNGLSGGFNFSVAPMINTVYSVIGTDTMGCTNTASVQIDVNSCMGLFDGLEKTERFEFIYPNPATDNVIVCLPDPERSYSISIFDSNCRLIKKIRSGELERFLIKRIDVGSGMFLVVIEEANSVIYRGHIIFE
jgi:PKD repeat protein